MHREANFDYDHHNPLIGLERYVFDSILIDRLCSITIDPRFISPLNFNALAYGRLVRRAFAPPEFSSLVDTIFSSKDERERIGSLSRDDAQVLIDVLDEARSALPHVQRLKPTLTLSVID